jgi:hypothetical protein
METKSHGFRTHRHVPNHAIAQKMCMVWVYLDTPSFSLASQTRMLVALNPCMYLVHRPRAS